MKFDSQLVAAKIQLLTLACLAACEVLNIHIWPERVGLKLSDRHLDTAAVYNLAVARSWSTMRHLSATIVMPAFATVSSKTLSLMPD